MSFLKAAVVLYQLVKGNRSVAVDVHVGVQHVVPDTKQWPKIRVCVGMDMPVYHIRLFCALPCKKWVMAERQVRA